MVSDYGLCDTSAIARPGTAPNRLLGGTPERQPRLQAWRDSAQSREVPETESVPENCQRGELAAMEKMHRAVPSPPPITGLADARLGLGKERSCSVSA